VSIKNSIDAVGNRTRELPFCSTLPQPTAPARVPYLNKRIILFLTLSVSQLKLCDIRTAVCCVYRLKIDALDNVSAAYLIYSDADYLVSK
jgi:hypothetical protein